MTSFVFLANSVAETDRLGAVMAELLPERATVALCGALGSGKTRLVQAIAAACDVPRNRVVSPTFVLCQEYHGRRSLFHLDAYRLRGSEEFLDLGPEEYFDGPGVTLVEWADRVADCLPADRLEVSIEVTGEGSRAFCLAAIGDRFEPVLAAIEARLRE